MTKAISSDSLLDELVREYGEEYRTVILRALIFLETNETLWHLDNPVSRRVIIHRVISGNR